MDSFKPYLAKVATGAALTREEARRAFDHLLSGEVTHAQAGAFLMALHVRGEALDEITGAAGALRERMTRVAAPEGAIDIVGTGGDHSGSYNVSTLAAIVTAACGVPVAKHGNRAASSRSGAADVLAALGVGSASPPITSPAASRKRACASCSPSRTTPRCATSRRCGSRSAPGRCSTCSGRSANPAGVSAQLLGVYAPSLAEPMTRVLAELGSRRVWTVHGSDGLDEITTTARPPWWRGKAARSAASTIDPRELGLRLAQPEELRGGDPAHNAGALREVLDGARTPYRDIGILNAAAA